jgi:hypothetical protein
VGRVKAEDYNSRIMCIEYHSFTCAPIVRGACVIPLTLDINKAHHVIQIYLIGITDCVVLKSRVPHTGAAEGKLRAESVNHLWV